MTLTLLSDGTPIRTGRVHRPDYQYMITVTKHPNIGQAIFTRSKQCQMGADRPPVTLVDMCDGVSYINRDNAAKVLRRWRARAETGEVKLTRHDTYGGEATNAYCTTYCQR